MIKIIIVIAALLAGLILGPEISVNKGYLLLSIDGYTTYETTIINALFIVFFFYSLLLLAEWLIRKLLSMSKLTRNWLGERKIGKAQKNTLLGMLALLEGDNKQAQKLLEKSAACSDSPALNYIAAAKAAHYQGKYDLRDEHLQHAFDSQKACQLAVGLVAAELQLEAKQYQKALATLHGLVKKFPKNKRISELYLSTYPALQQWQNYIDLLNSKGNDFSFSKEELAAKRLDAYHSLFKQMAEQGELQDFWDKKSPRWMRKELSYQKALLDAYIESGADKLAEQFLLEKLNKQCPLPLLVYLEKLQISNHYPLILLLEKKLPKESEKGEIHRALARLQLKEGKVGAAIAHLQESIETLANIDDFALLAELLQNEGREMEANEYYRQGLLFAASVK